MGDHKLVPHGGSGQVPTALALDTEAARRFAQAARSEATLRAYRSDWADFAAWCGDRQLVAMPALPETVALYVASAAPKPLETINREAVITSALDSAARAVELGLGADRIVISCKMSRVQDLISVYDALAAKSDFALHLGLTEAGMGSKGIVASTAALSVLLQRGIGDTIRISLTPEPGGDRTREVVVAQEILQTMGLRSFTPMVTACPGCGRTSSTRFQELADRIQSYLRDSMPEWKGRYAGVEDMTVAVMGCVVNGPGESKHADIGISLPGTGERPVAPVYIDGERAMTLKGETIAEAFQGVVERYVEARYGSGASARAAPAAEPV